MSDLSNFCKAILEVISQEECDQPDWFFPGSGLCFNSGEYDLVHDTEAHKELKALFEGNDYPFNTGRIGYDREYFAQTIYQNSKRLAFLIEHAGLASN